MTEQLLERVAIVTGASNGIGRGIAEALAAAGAKTALAARRTEMLVEVASGIRNAGGTALPVATDVTREDQVVQLFKKACETYGRVDILVNNAGVPTHVPIEDITLKYWQEVLDVNLTAAFLCSREAIKIMKSHADEIVRYRRALPLIKLAVGWAIEGAPFNLIWPGPYWKPPQPRPSAAQPAATPSNASKTRTRS